MERYRGKSVQVSNEIYLRMLDALAVIDDADKEDFAILGIECFDLQGDKVRPRLDRIADLSPRAGHAEWRSYQRWANSAARRFFTQFGEPGLVVNLAVLTLAEWERTHPVSGSPPE
jgi:hypothetical protein